MRQIIVTSSGTNTGSEQTKLLIVLSALVLIAVFVLFQINGFLFEYGLLSAFKVPFWTPFVLGGIAIAYPFVCIKLLKNHRLSLMLGSFVLLTGDYTPGLTSSLAVLITLPNFLYLLYLNRHSRIKYLLLPLLLLSVIYFFNAFLLNFIANPVKVTYVDINLGWLGAFGGALIVYHLMYLPLVIYHLACTDKAFFKTYSVWLSVFINIVALYGLYQFITVGLSSDDILFRVNSIFRNTNRLGPFILVSMTLLIKCMLETSDRRYKLYWWFSLMVSIFVLLLTYSRAAIGVGIVLWFFLLLTFITSRAYKKMAFFLFNTLMLLFVIKYLGHFFQIDYLQRFQWDNVEYSYEKRVDILQAYLDAIGYQGTSWWHQTANILFGYGWFSERRLILMDTHNTFFSCFATFGLVGVVLYFMPYAWMIWVTFIGCFQGTSRKLRHLNGMACALFVAFLVGGTLHNKLYSPIESAYMWLLAGILLQDQLPILFPQKSALDTKCVTAKPQRLICLKQ